MGDEWFLWLFLNLCPNTNRAVPEISGFAYHFRTLKGSNLCKYCRAFTHRTSFKAQAMGFQWPLGYNSFLSCLSRCRKYLLLSSQWHLPCHCLRHSYQLFLVAGILGHLETINGMSWWRKAWMHLLLLSHVFSQIIMLSINNFFWNVYCLWLLLQG